MGPSGGRSGSRRRPAGSYTAWSSAFRTGRQLDRRRPPALGGPAILGLDHSGRAGQSPRRGDRQQHQITLTWSPVLELTSGIDHYNIYRDGSLYATSTSTSYTDTIGISSQSRHSYRVAAVNYDGVVGFESAAVTAEPTGIAAITTPTTTSVQVQFTEPVDPTTAQTLANYSISGVTISAVVLQSDGYTVTLTTSALGGSSHVLTVSNVKTRNLSSLPTLTASFSLCVGRHVRCTPFQRRRQREVHRRHLPRP